MRILAVDDNEVALHAIHVALEAEGYDVELATDGEKALEIIRSKPIRMVICDWMMPHMNGLELCACIRKEELPAYVYIILLTSRTDPEDVVAGLSAGADEFITKPFHPSELRARIRTGARILAMETREMAIFAMAKLAEFRDPETGTHLERVRGYARILAETIANIREATDELDPDFAHLVYLTSPLHDIGKVGIPDYVLLKQGPLTAHEFEIMKGHTRIGAEVLEAGLAQYPDAAFLRMARDIALTHHERFDGTGYPQGLVGEAIPLVGRIVALADVYDALSSKRVYKEAFSHEVARSIILDERGRHFDPQVVDAFVAQEAAFLAVRARFKAEEDTMTLTQKCGAL